MSIAFLRNALYYRSHQWVTFHLLPTPTGQLCFDYETGRAFGEWCFGSAYYPYYPV